jgi:hypothetical protein
LVLYEDELWYPHTRLGHDNYAFTFIYTIPGFVESASVRYTWNGRRLTIPFENPEEPPSHWDNSVLKVLPYGED